MIAGAEEKRRKEEEEEGKGEEEGGGEEEEGAGEKESFDARTLPAFRVSLSIKLGFEERLKVILSSWSCDLLAEQRRTEEAITPSFRHRMMSQYWSFPFKTTNS